MFGRLLDARSFNSWKGPLAYKQAFLPIAFGNIGFILTTTITPTTYLRNWAFIISIIASRFMIDQCLFFLEALTWVNNNTSKRLAISHHPQHTCFFPFEQFIGQQMVWLQDSVLEHLHHHTLSNMLSDKIFKTHCAQILSCSGPKVGVWFKTWSIFPAFELSSPSFSTTFQTQLGLPHLSIVNIFHYVCTHPIDATNVHLFVAPMAMNT